MTILRAVLGTGAVLVVLGAVAIVVCSAIGAGRFQQAYDAEKSALLQRGTFTPAYSVDPAAVGELPAPVKRYLELSGALSAPPVRTVVLKQAGAIRTAAGKPWMAFEAEQVYSVEPPGFLWLARSRFAPFIDIWVRDKFVDGRGNMLVRLFGLFALVDADGPGIDQGAALRFWGEIIAFPSAVLSPHLAWHPVGANEARMLIAQGGLQLDARVEFTADGEPTAFHANRYRDVNGRQVLTPFSGFLTDWKVVDGKRIPAHWEAVWHLAEGDLTYVKIDVLAVRQE